MNQQNQLCGAQQESPIQRANQRLMSGQAETHKLLEELRMKLRDILHPEVPKVCDPGNGAKTPPRDLAAPLTDGTNDRAGEQDMINTALRDILSRIEL